jgi:iron complex transport system substrate-binding protein
LFFKKLKVLLLFFLLLPLALRAGFPVSFIDCLGRNVALQSAPERIVITGRAGFMITNAAFFFPEASEKLVAYSKYFQSKSSDEFYKLVDAKFPTRNFSHDTMSIEELAALKPDVVLARNFERQNLEKGLKQLGIPVVFLNLETPQAYYSDIKNLGHVFNDKATADKVISFYKNKQEEIKNLVNKSSKEQPITALHVFYSERGGSTSFSVSPIHWIQALMIKKAGAMPVWSEIQSGKGWKKIGFEQIAAWDPDYIFVSSYFSDVDEAVSRLKSNLLWKNLEAVKNKNLLAFPGDFVSWDQPDSRWILGQAWLAAVLHSETDKLKSFSQKLLVEFFQLYGLNKQQIKNIEIHGDYF